MRKLIYSLTFVLILHCTFNVENCSAQWVQMSNGMPTDTVYSLAANGYNILGGTAHHGVYLLNYNGNSWIQAGLNNQTVKSLAVNGSNIFATADTNGVWFSNNNGTNWTQTTLNNENVMSLALLVNNVFAGTANNSVYFSTNNGLNWRQSLLSFPASVRTIVVSGNNILAGTYQWPDPGRIYLTTNKGVNWTQILQLGVSNEAVISIALRGNDIFAGTFGGVYRSTNNGANWSSTPLNDKFVNSIAISGNNILAATSFNYTGGGVYLSTNSGDSWVPINSGFNDTMSVYKLLILNNYLYAGTHLSVWRRPLSEINIITGMRNIGTETPSKYSLSQNYPNPFNPTTNIKFNVAKLSDVKIVVYDIMGREVQTLVNESLQPGVYETTFNGSMLNSGIYFYRLTTNMYSESRKMILLK